MNRGILRLVIWSFGIAVVAVGLWWLMWWLAGESVQSVINDITTVIFEPALVVAIFLSGHPDNLNGVIWFGSQVVEIFIVVLVVGSAISFARNASRKRSQ